MPDFLPAGALVSQAIDAEADFRTVAQRVLTAIDAVHGDGQLPVISAGFESSLSGYAEAEYHYDSLSDAALEIRVSQGAETPELSFLHETGHFLDHKGLSAPHFLAQDGSVTMAGTLFLLDNGQEVVHQDDFGSETNPALSTWKEAVMATDAVERLQRVMQYRSAKVTARDGERVSVDIDPAYVTYLLEDRELFARSYAQYIVTNSQNGILQRQLDDVREEPLAQIYPLYWDDEDFLSVAEAMDDVFLKRGWAHE